MASADEAVKRRPYALGLVILVHVLIGLMLFWPSGAGRGLGHPTSVLSGPGTALAPARTAPEPAGRPFRLSFDRTGLVGPSTLPPPTRATHAAHTVAPPRHPS